MKRIMDQGYTVGVVADPGEVGWVQSAPTDWSGIEARFKVAVARMRERGAVGTDDELMSILSVFDLSDDSHGLCDCGEW